MMIRRTTKEIQLILELLGCTRAEDYLLRDGLEGPRTREAWEALAREKRVSPRIERVSSTENDVDGDAYDELVELAIRRQDQVRVTRGDFEGLARAATKGSAVLLLGERDDFYERVGVRIYIGHRDVVLFAHAAGLQIVEGYGASFSEALAHAVAHLPNVIPEK